MAIDKVLTGIAGEYFVAAELSRRGYIAALTQRNTAGVDLLASSADGSRSVSIQVKTTTGKRASWRLSSKSEKVKDKNLFYVFVRLNSVNEMPDYYVASSAEVAAYIAKTHRKWLSAPTKNGSQRKDTSMRAFDADEAKHHDQWKNLGI